MSSEILNPELARYVKALSLSKTAQLRSPGEDEAVKTTPLFSWEVKLLFDSPTSSHSSESSIDDSINDSVRANLSSRGESSAEDSERADPSSGGESDDIQPAPRAEILSQFAVLGCSISHSEVASLFTVDVPPPPAPVSPVFLNTNAPWSAFLCGSQGSGKSYTLSCMLENCLLREKNIGRMSRPLAGLLFHYDPHSSDNICEAAHLASHIPVNVLCSPSNLYNMKKLYENIPSTKGNIHVHPLFLKDQNLNTERMKRLMAFSEKDGPAPLYMEILTKILKDMATENEGKSPFKYSDFKAKVDAEPFSKENQKGPLQLRLQLLESFIESGALAKKFRRAEGFDAFQARPECLTIVDLTDPFVDAASACVLFDIALALFLESKTDVGKVVALDEAHKFIDQSSASSLFTENLLMVIREQRHKGTRVIIATQEPTISPKLLDLCSMTFVHRFTSPEWMATLKHHLAGASRLGGQSEEDQNALFKQIVELNVGESLMFSPSAMLHVVNGKAQKLGMNYLKFRTRSRITSDGGDSIMAT